VFRGVLFRNFFLLFVSTQGTGGLWKRRIYSALGFLFLCWHAVLPASGAILIAPSSLPSGTLYTPYSVVLSGAGGIAPYSFAVSSGHLPAGLTLSADGTISGTPRPAGIPRPETFSNFTITATDSAGSTGSQKYTLLIYATGSGSSAAPLAVTTASLPAGTVGTAYSIALTASGGTPPYAWTLTSGSLPPGLSLTTSGVISGTPAAVGTLSFTVQVSDSNGLQASATLSLAVVPALAVSSSSLPEGTVNTAYSATLTASGGASPYTWSILSGILPAGTSLGTATGAISGTPTAAGSYNFSVQVTDSAGRTASAALNVVIASALVITSSAVLPGGTVGTAYSATLTSSGGAAPVSWVVASGALPAGLSLSQAGVLSGTPAAAGPFTFVVKATDVLGNSASQSCTINIAALASGGSLTIMNADLPNGVVNAPYSVSLAASGGTPPYTWAVTSGSLPAGLTLDPKAGTISGTPTTPGWSGMITIQATDAASSVSSLPYSFSVKPVLDQYGGLVGQSCPSTGYFHPQKVANRWWLCTPSGNLMWYAALGGAFNAGNGCDPATGMCSTYDTIATAKYGDLNVHYGPQQNRRLQLWGFDAVGELSSGYMYPIMTCPGCDGWPNGQQPVMMPMTQTIVVSPYAGVNISNYALNPTKNITFGLNTNYTGWRAAMMDFFDPDFTQWMNNYFANDPGIKPFLTSNWVIGLFLDDTDWFWGMGAGPDFHTIPAGHTNAHSGYLTLISSPQQTYNPDPSSRGVAELYSDSKVYSKVAMSFPPSTCSSVTPCSLRDFLYQKYGGNISSLNQAWGSNYTTFDSSGAIVSGELIGTGDGTTAQFSHVLARTPVSPESVLLRISGSPVGGDCPWWNTSCSISGPNVGSLGSPSGGVIASGPQPWLTDFAWQTCSNCGLPPASYWVKITYHMQPGYTSTPSREVGGTSQTPNGQIVVAPPAPVANATGWDIYVSCENQSSPGVSWCGPLGTWQNGAETLQASNIPFGQSWVEPTSGLVTGGARVPSPASSINYANGQLTVTFATPPPAGAQVTVDYTANGWMYGTGLMDEDGRHTAWLGNNPYCLSAALSCDGVDNPLPNANANVAADLDAWLTQFAAQYFGSCRSSLKKYAPNLLYLGADTIGDWGVPARKQILSAAGQYVDVAFTTWFAGQPDSATSSAMYAYLTQYLGDKPIINFMGLQSNPDSSLYLYPSGYVEGASTQAQRGQMYESIVNTMLTTPSYNGTYQWLGIAWWGLTDYWNEKLDWGLVSLSDNAYDGKSASVTARTDPWGFSTGGEQKGYGDAVDLVKQANSLWWAGLASGSLP
jgi:hypothetical protein